MLLINTRTIMVLYVRTYYLSTNFIYVKFIEHNLKK
jgi:hypothetical protein